MDKDIKEAIKDSLEVDVVTEALEAYLEAEGETALRDNRLVVSLPDHQLTPVTDKRLAKVVTNATKNKAHRRIQLRTLLIAALAASLLLATQAGALRSAIGNYFLQLTDQSIDYTNQPDPGHSQSMDIHIPLPRDIPAGFAEDEGQRVYLADYAAITYRNETGDSIEYVVYEDEASVRLDWSDTAYEAVEISGMPGGRVLKDGQVTLFWGRQPPMELHGPAHLYEELLRMAKSVDLPE